MTGLCLSRRTVLCTPHAHSCSQPGSSFCISVQERYFLFALLPPRCTSMSLDLELAKILDEFAVPEAFRASFWIQPALKFGNLLNMSTMSRTGQVFSPVSSHRSWTACISCRSDAHTKQRVRETPSFSPGVATIQAKIWTHQSSQTGGAP